MNRNGRKRSTQNPSKLLSTGKNALRVRVYPHQSFLINKCDIRLSLLYRSSLFEICRIRTEPGFDDLDAARNRASELPLVYKIRIVCQEGAIVRDGIDIDHCESVGNIEMGEIVYAYDRCINSSGVLRYRTSRGWVSELARGHGRENITEVLDISIGAHLPLSDTGVNSKRTECGVPDLRSAAASVLTRLYGSQVRNQIEAFEKMLDFLDGS